jgi:nicotinamidase-related amidase
MEGRGTFEAARMRESRPRHRSKASISMTDQTLTIDPATTALVLVDLQKGVLPFAKAPHGPEAVLANAIALVQAFRAAKAAIVRVRVGFSADGGDRLRQPVDAPSPAGPTPDDWLADPEGLPALPGDIEILKRQWGAFHGTELDLQLRRRGIRTLVLGGISTAIGVESTARAAFEHGYEIVFPEDLSSSPAEAPHRNSFGAIFPRLGRVRTTAQVLAAMKV